MSVLYEIGAGLAARAGALALLLGCLNLAVFALYGADKRRAVRGMRRVPERTLLLAAALGGGVGALAAMQIFRHKTRHLKFTVPVPVFAAVQLAFFVVLPLWASFGRLS